MRNLTSCETRHLYGTRHCRAKGGTFPKLSCSCSAGGGSYHVAAVKQAIGMRENVQHRKLNLTQLCKNKCNRPDKTSGRKRPRIADVDVIAAPDADPTVASAATGHVDASREIEPLAITYAARRQPTWKQTTMLTTR